jgi:predicted transcriptional regulator
MITVHLDPKDEERLTELAKQQGRDVSQLAAHIIDTYLDTSNWACDADEQWAESSVELAAEILDDEDWTEEGSVDGPR